MLDAITPLIITFNEVENIQRTLAKLNWANRIVVVDSGSSDGTLDILKSDRRIDVHHNRFADFASQCNFGLKQVSSDWVLSLDADYVLSNVLIEEMSRLRAPKDVAGYRARFVYKVVGRSLSGSLYPPRVILYRRHQAHYVREGHGHRVEIRGHVAKLNGPVYHDDRKVLSRWASSQMKYASEERAYLLDDRGSAPAKFADRVRRIGWPAPVLVFAYTLLIKGCLFDGWAGWHYSLQRLIAECLIALEISEQRLRKNEPSGE
jgi:glycosyltransferase involved in cell wall biosynthesis